MENFNSKIVADPITTIYIPFPLTNEKYIIFIYNFKKTTKKKETLELTMTLLVLFVIGFLTLNFSGFSQTVVEIDSATGGMKIVRNSK
jgi:uncharacterized protein with PQ loop repeat